MSTYPVVLLILDGWGQAPSGPGNAFTLAKTPNLDSILANQPTASLLCSGRAVGLPDGYMGNSEVGHINIGAGRIVYQDMTRIDIACEDGSIGKNKTLLDVFSAVKASGGNLHFMGLLSDGGVHSHINHLKTLVNLSHGANIPSIVHAFADGRDTAPDSGIRFMKELTSFLPSSSSVGTVSGRYYAMDRDKRWERTEKAWNAIVDAKGETATTALEALEQSYAASLNDEFVLPTVVGSYSGIKDGDAVVMFNFRSDRMRSLAHAFCDEPFDGFTRSRLPKLSGCASMTQYESDLPIPVLFAPQGLENGLGEVISKTEHTQLRIAETEKYAHVTYFFNGGREEPFTGEDRCLIPSPREVSTYDQKPQMSVYEVTEKLLQALETKPYDFVACNLANMDMVGHTGIIPAAIAACEAVDTCVGKILAEVKKKKGVLLVTADHGNAEEMLASDNAPQTSHSKNPVPFVLNDFRDTPVKKLKAQGKLGDIAPTVLTLMHIEIPKEMSGDILCEGS